MGIVYKAYQTSLNREVALKTLPPALSIDKNLVDRFHREAESAARLSHPNIVQIFDINEVDGIHFFAMEYLKGQTLTQKMEKEAPLPVKEAIMIASAVADALDYSHTEGIIHRDIKPGNIMISPHGHVKVTDFGLARMMESSRLTLTGTIIGTPEYMSPEQARGDPLDGRSDLYSLGIVFYEVLTGKLPFTANTPFAVAQKQIYDPLPSPCSIRPEIPGPLGEVIIKATQKDPGQRYQRGEDFKNDIEAFATGTGLERITPTVVVPPVGEAIPLGVEKGGAQRRLLKRLGLGVLVLGAILLIGFFFFLPKMKEEVPQEPVGKIIPPPLVTGKPSEDEAKKIIADIRRFSALGAYRDAIRSLEKFMEEFPDHPQTDLIPQRIKELQDREVGEKFKKAQEVADTGEIVQAILEFNQIARDYPETAWETKSNEKVEELKRILKEGEAEKEFLEAQELKRKKKFIEATQGYQNIISRFPGTTWAEKSQEEIAKLKEAQVRIQEKNAQRIAEAKKKEIEQPKKEPVYREPPPEFREPPEEAKKIVESIKRSDPNIEKLIRLRDERKMAGYLWSRHKADLEKIAMTMGIASGRIDKPFLHMVARYLMEGDMDFALPPTPGPEDKLFEKFRKKAQSNKTTRSYIKRRDTEALWLYLMSRYYKEIKEMSKKLDRPFRELARDFAERLVHDRGNQDMEKRR